MRDHLSTKQFRRLRGSFDAVDTSEVRMGVTTTPKLAVSVVRQQNIRPGVRSRANAVELPATVESRSEPATRAAQTEA